MSALHRLRLPVRMSLGFGVLLLMLAAMGGIAVYNLSATSAVLGRVFADDWVRAQALATLETVTRDNANASMELLLNPDPERQRVVRERIRANRQAVTDALENLERLAPDAQVREALAAVTEARTRYVVSFQRIDEELQAGQREQAVQRAGAETVRLLETLLERVQVLAGMHHQLALGNAEAVLSGANLAVTLTLVLGGAALVVGAGFAWALTRSVTQPISQAVRVAQAVAEGRLGTAIECGGRDEVGDLLRALRHMDERLARVVAAVRANAESVATASAQIAQGNQDLSQRTEQQAGALQQTAASMEQLGSTVQQNADTARRADELARGASGVAGRGGDAVARVVATMQGIRDSSHRIADITGTIDAIAFQTNLLALNAAVEAARAGAQGRGFAVVAGEVRSLAQRSAQAAHEIKSLIAASVGQVESGSALVQEAGSMMGEVVGAIRGVSELVAGISRASAQQSAGVLQIGQAVSQMDDVTQQNAALVEESAAAAESLQQQARRLVEAVAVFELAPEAGARGG